MDAQGHRSGAPAAVQVGKDESLITDILTIPLPKLVDTSVPCLISWAGDKIDRGDYEPGKVRIGPFHRLDPSEQADWMEQQKKQELRGLLVSREEDEAGRREELRRYLEAMEGMEGDARRCYNRTFNWMTKKEFARMLLLDGCFLYSRFVSGSVDDITVDRDIVFLLENQIPFFVLEKIHMLLIASGSSDAPSAVVLDKVASRVEQVLRRNIYSVATLDRTSCPRPCHLLHLLYMYFTPAAAGKQMELLPHQVLQVQEQEVGRYSICRVPVPQLVRWRTATQYHAAGVRLVARKLDGEKVRSILDVELSGEDTLHVPCLTVDNNTFRMLRNMVALEQKGLQQQTRTSHVTAYCLFMSQLASTEEDVELLVSKNIIVHLLRSNGDVADGLAGLCDGVIIDAYDPDSNYLRSKYEALEKLLMCHSARARRNHSMAWLRSHWKGNKYFLALAIMANIFIFLLMVQQFVSAALRNGKGRC